MSEPREGSWLSPPLKPRKRLFEFAGPWATPFYALGYVQSRWGKGYELLFIVLGLIWFTVTFAALAFFPLRELWIRLLKHRDRRFADKVPGIEEFSVEMIVSVKNKAIGADRGVIWFDRGLLGFTGERTSFLLAYDDLVVSKAKGILAIDIPYRPLRLKAGNKADVTIRPLWGQRRGYRNCLRRFLRERKSVDEDRQWPPLAPLSASSMSSRLDS